MQSLVGARTSTASWRLVHGKVGWIGLVLALLLTYMGLGFGQADAATEASRGERLLTVHDRGQERVFLTTASTVGEALKRAGIEVNNVDTVEPGVEEELVANDYQVNIYRARPVIVIDGLNRQRVMTSYQTPSQIVEAAGLELYPEDITSMGLPADLLSAGGGVELNINRATPLKLVLYGKATEVRTQSLTVREMLSEKNINLSDKDKLSVGLDDEIKPGMTIELWRDGRQTITEEEDVAFEIEKIQDADREIGFREIKTPGEKGRRTVTYEIVMKNGKEVSRKEIASVTTKQPKKQVEVVGAKSPPVAGPAEIIDRINYWSSKRGIDGNRVARIAKCESGFNPMADSGYYKGLFQHDPNYWPARAAQYGHSGASIFDVEAQIAVSTGMMAGGGWSHWGCK